MYCRVSRDVKKVEELTMPHVPVYSSLEARRLELYQRRGITCWCDRCRREIRMPAPAAIPDIGPVNMFTAAEISTAGVKGIKIDEIWGWMQYQANRARYLKAEGNLRACYFP